MTTSRRCFTTSPDAPLAPGSVAHSIVGISVNPVPEAAVEGWVEHCQPRLDRGYLAVQILIVANPFPHPRVDDHQVREDLGLVIRQVAGAVEIQKAGILSHETP